MNSIDNIAGCLIIAVSIVLLATGLSVRLSRPIKRKKPYGVVRGYMIERTTLGQRSFFVVPEGVMKRALHTGDYKIHGFASSEEAGNLFANDGTGGTGVWVPGGYLVDDGKHVYTDERLNG